MDQEIRPKCKSIIKRQSTLENQNQVEQGQHQHQDQHVKFGEMHVDMILKEDQYQIEQDNQNSSSIQKPQQYKNLSEAELIKLALKKPEVLEEDEQ